MLTQLVLADQGDVALHLSKHRVVARHTTAGRNQRPRAESVSYSRLTAFNGCESYVGVVRAGINPQERLPVPHDLSRTRDIHSTLVYITVTQDLSTGERTLSQDRSALSARVGRSTAMKPADPFLDCYEPSFTNGWSSNATLPPIPFAHTATPGACFSDSLHSAGRGR